MRLFGCCRWPPSMGRGPCGPQSLHIYSAAATPVLPDWMSARHMQTLPRPTLFPATRPATPDQLGLCLPNTGHPAIPGQVVPVASYPFSSNRTPSHTHTKGISKLKLCTNSLNIIHLIQAKLKTRTLTTPEAENTEPQRRCALCFVVNVHSTLVLWIKGSFEKLKTDLAHPKIEPSKTTNSRACSFYPFLTGVTAASATG